MFEVLAGLDRKFFLAHPSILVKSDKLKALVEGGWKDSLERKIVLEDWDEETVVRLLEWLYTDNYSSPHPQVLWSTSAPVLADDPAAEVADNVEPEDFSPPPADMQTTVALKKAYMAEPGPNDAVSSLISFTCQHFDAESPQRKPSSAEAFETWAKDYAHHDQTIDFGRTLHAHAKLYCLANYMLLPDLQALAFHHMKATLKTIGRLVAETPSVNTLVALVRHVYDNTIKPEEGEEPLQELLTTFVAANFAAFTDGDGGEVRTLLNEGGDFAVDVWEKVRENMMWLEKNLGESKVEIGQLRQEVQSFKRKKGRAGSAHVAG